LEKQQELKGEPMAFTPIVRRWHRGLCFLLSNVFHSQQNLVLI